MLGTIREQLQRRNRTALDPPSNGHHRPDGLDHAEGPRALQESIKRAKTTSDGERQNEPPAPVLERVTHEHRGDCEEAE